VTGEGKEKDVREEPRSLMRYASRQKRLFEETRRQRGGKKWGKIEGSGGPTISSTIVSVGGGKKRDFFSPRENRISPRRKKRPEAPQKKIPISSSRRGGGKAFFLGSGRERNKP